MFIDKNIIIRTISSGMTKQGFPGPGFWTKFFIYRVLGLERFLDLFCFVLLCICTDSFVQFACVLCVLYCVSRSISCSIYLKIELYGRCEYSLATFVDNSWNDAVSFVPRACLPACLPDYRRRARPLGESAGYLWIAPRNNQRYVYYGSAEYTA